jgi:hypothetical protein
MPQNFDQHIIDRQEKTWGTTYGKSGIEPLRYVKICELEDSHIDAIIKMFGERVDSAIPREREYRKYIFKERVLNRIKDIQNEA